MANSTQAWSVEFYVDSRGRSPALDYLRSLSSNEQAEAVRLLDLLQKYGTAIGMPHARPIAGLWELRPGSNRFFYVAHTGRRFIVLHGYRKRSQAAPAREIETAKRRLADFLDREQAP